MKKSPNYRRNQSGSSLFEKAQTLEALSKQGNPLEFISKMIDFEIFALSLRASYKPLNARVIQGVAPLTLY
jgi:hypothetical protein